MITTIGLTAPPQSGKTAIAKLLLRQITDYQSKPMSFAKPLKDIAYFVGWDGKKDQEGRKLLHVIGDVMRKSNPNCFIEFAENELSYHAVNIFDDVRFDQEADLIHEHGGIVIEIIPSWWSWYRKLIWKLRVLFGREHRAECGIDRKKIDYRIKNSNLDQAVLEIEELVNTKKTIYHIEEIWK